MCTIIAPSHPLLHSNFSPHLDLSGTPRGSTKRKCIVERNLYKTAWRHVVKAHRCGKRLNCLSCCSCGPRRVLMITGYHWIPWPVLFVLGKVPKQVNLNKCTCAWNLWPKFRSSTLRTYDPRVIRSSPSSEKDMSTCLPTYPGDHRVRLFKESIRPITMMYYVSNFQN